ncbi:MAG: EF-hand domain-containing protein [Pseudonocardiaceae bacterium]
MAISEFVKRKLSIAFYRFDYDKDGVVAENDFVQLGQEVAKLQGLDADSVEAASVIEAHRAWWDAYFKDADGDDDGQVTIEEYFAAVDAWVGGNPDALSHAIASNGLVFDTIDQDGDGKLSLNEFSLYLQAYGLATTDAATAFGHLDLDGDGYISRDEFAKNMSEYYISEDRPSPSEWFFGGH